MRRVPPSLVDERSFVADTAMILLHLCVMGCLGGRRMRFRIRSLLMRSVMVIVWVVWHLYLIKDAVEISRAWRG
jgi:hypothetical protein